MFYSTKGFSPHPRTLATDAEADLSIRDAEIALVQREVDSLRPVDTDEGRAKLAHALDVLNALNEARADAYAQAEALMTSTMEGHPGSIAAGGAA
jgi:hypothetical protein